MVNRCVAAGCSNTPSDRVSLFKFLEMAPWDGSGKDKSSEAELNGRRRINRFSVATILLKTALKWTVRLLHNSGWRKGDNWSPTLFLPSFPGHPSLVHALVWQRRAVPQGGKGQLEVIIVALLLMRKGGEELYRRERDRRCFVTHLCVIVVWIVIHTSHRLSKSYF